MLFCIDFSLMPQLKSTTYLTQYRGSIIVLVSLYILLVGLVLPIIKTNFLIRRSIFNYSDSVDFELDKKLLSSMLIKAK